MNKTDVVIVGAGPVGLFAVHQLGIKRIKSCCNRQPRQSWRPMY